MASVFERDETPDAGAGDGKWLKKIRLILKKASAEGVTDAEREMLNAKASELCAKFGIDKARAVNAGESGDELAFSPYTFYDATHRAQAELMYYIAEALGCKCCLGRGDGEYDSTGLSVIGYLSDIERAELFFEFLYLQMISGSLRHVAKDRKSFMRGFAVEVGERIKATENIARADGAPAGSSMALVLVSREVAVKDAFKKEFPSVGHSYGRISADGYEAGRAAGKSANLGGKGVGNSRAAIAG